MVFIAHDGLSLFTIHFGLCCKDCMHKYFDMNFFLFLSSTFTLCCSLNLSRSIVNIVILIVFLKLGILKIDLQHTRRYERTCNDGNIENCLRNHYHHHNIQYLMGRRWGVVSVVVAVIFIE